MIVNEKILKVKGRNIHSGIFSSSNKNNKLVIILTGDGVNGTMSSTWPPLIKALVDSDYKVLSFDFNSQGKSEGDRLLLNISTASEDYLSLWDYYENELKNNSINIIASSFGAAVLLNTLNKYSRYDSIIFKSPVSSLKQTYEFEHNENEMKNWAAKGVSSVTGKSYSAYQMSIGLDLLKNTNLISCPVLIINGDEDQIVPLAHSIQLKESIGDNCTINVYKGVKHNYKQYNAKERFVTDSIDFLNEHQQ
jgi:pimeloyl-ACP methyl ester carboxylesterase